MPLNNIKKILKIYCLYVVCTLIWRFNVKLFQYKNIFRASDCKQMVAFCDHFFCWCDYILWAVTLAQPPRCPTRKRCHFCCIWETSNGKRNKRIKKFCYSFELHSAVSLSAGTETQTNLSELRTALLRNQSWFCDTVTAQRCEIQWEGFEFAAEWIKIAVRCSEMHSNSAQNSVL